MHPETKHDLKRMSEIKSDIRSLEDELRTIKENCKHNNLIVELVENLQFERKAAYVCIVCDHEEDKKVSKKDQMKVWKEDFPYLSKKEIEKIIKEGGYNLPDHF